MSDDSQRGYLFGILQRGARPVGRANRGRGVLSGPGALENSNTVDNQSAPVGVDRVSESATAAEVSTNTQGQRQTKQLPQRLPSTLQSPTHAADTSPETPTPTATKSFSVSQPGTKPIDSSAHQVKLAAAEISSESFLPAELKADTPSLNQTKPVAHAQRLKSRPHSPTQAADSPPERPTPTATKSFSVSQPGTKPIDSSSHQVKLAAAEISSESFLPAELNAGTPSLNQTKPVAHAQRLKSRPHSPTQAADSSPEKPTATSTRSVSVSPPDPKPTDSSSHQGKLAAATTSSESSSSSPLELSVPSEILNQTKPTATPQRLQLRPHSPTHAADTSPEKTMATDARSTAFSQPGNQQPDSTVQPATFSAAEFDANFLPLADSVHNNVKPAPADRWLSESRLPRLTVIEQGGKTISPDTSSQDTTQASRSIVVDETGEFFESRSFAELRTDDRGQPLTQVPSSQASATRSSAQSDRKPDRTPTQDTRIINRETSPSHAVPRNDQVATSLPVEQIGLSESIETIKSLPRAVTLKEHVGSPTNAAPSQSLHRESSQSMLAVAPEDTPAAPVARFGGRPTDSIAERTKVTAVPAQAERMEDSLAWRGSLPAQPEEQYSRGPFVPQEQRAAPTPKLTIKRIDVQIVNQSPAPTAPPAVAPAPAVPGLPSDGWENLERHQLGHLDLMP